MRKYALTPVSIWINTHIFRSLRPGLSISGEQYRRWMFNLPNLRHDIDRFFLYWYGEENHCRNAYAQWLRTRTLP